MTSSRQRIADIALQMFSESGYDTVSMRDLAAALRIQAPSIYSHYASKDDLLHVILTPLLDSVDDVIARAPAPPVSSQQRRGWLEDYIGLLIDQRVAARFAMIDGAVRHHPVLRPRLREQHQRVCQIIRDFGAPDDPTAMAVLGAACFPIFFGYFPSGELRTLTDQVDQILERFNSLAQPAR